MSVPGTAELLAFLQEHEFLTPGQAQQLAGDGPGKFAEARAVARELVARNWLTAFQANLTLQGKGEELLLGTFRLMDRLGEGGMGQVFQAYHVTMGRVVALKVIRADWVSNPVALGRFHREVRAVAKLSHPNIVTAFEFNQVGKTHFLVMEHVDGIDLARLVRQSGPLPIPNACDYVRQAAVGLQHAHAKGLVHRDIKPGNLMVARPHPDEPPFVKVLDFGLARFESESDHANRLTQPGGLLGTVDYMAPEQAQDARTADIRADIYSLGCSLFYLLTAKPPFTGEGAVERLAARALADAPSVRESRPEVPPALDAVLARMMARDPAQRYQTPGEVAKALEPHTEKGKQVVTTPAPAVASPFAVLADTEERRGRSTKSARRTRRSIPAVAWVSAAVILLCCVVVGAVVWSPAGSRTDTAPQAKSTGSALGRPTNSATQPAPKDTVATSRDTAPPPMDPATTPAKDPATVPAKDPPPRPAGEKIDVEIAKGVKMTFCWIPPGEATLGSPATESGRTDNEPEHKYTSRGYWLAKYPATQEQWQALMKNNPSGFQPSQKTIKRAGITDTSGFPVEQVSWDDCQEFLNKMNASVQVPGGMGKGRFALPHEDEWEYACRGDRGNKQPFYFGDSLNGDKANCNGTVPYGNPTKGEWKQRTTKVGDYEKAAPHPWGLCDMHGNVGQWCENQYGVDASLRVLRAGSWRNDASACRAAFRRWGPLDYRVSFVGFRVCFRPD
jgi:serine/threonine protein kinase/formylglycine-generating enzyme required for sulfatase activity